MGAAAAGLKSEGKTELAELVDTPESARLDAGRLKRMAQSVVEASAVNLRGVRHRQDLQLQVERVQGPEKWHVHSVCNVCVAHGFFTTAFREGIVLFEPFGGLCADLEMVLKLGVKVKKYLYSDIGKAANAVAKHRVRELSLRYPHLLTGPSIKGMYDLPADVYKVDSEALIRAGALKGDQWLVVAGWECQDLSPAGSCKGLEGSKSSTFYPLV